MATVRIEYGTIESRRPGNLRYEPEHAGGRFHGYQIRTGSVVLTFERAHGRLVHATDETLVELAARRLGLEPSGGGPLGWKLPDAWVRADPYFRQWSHAWDGSESWEVQTPE
jgi:hypothetical protein